MTTCDVLNALGKVGDTNTSELFTEASRCVDNLWMVQGILGRRTEQKWGMADMRALRFHKAGSLDELKVEELPRPIPAAGEILIQVKAAAINPSIAPKTNAPPS